MAIYFVGLVNFVRTNMCVKKMVCPISGLIASFVRASVISYVIVVGNMAR
jgi:hypothetical protein